MAGGGGQRGRKQAKRAREGREQVGWRLPATLMDSLRAQAAQGGITVSALVERLLTAGLSEGLGKGPEKEG